MTSDTRPVDAPKRKNRHVQRLTKRDKITLAVMVSIPVLIEAVLIWIPTVLSILLSFTTWNGLSLSNIRSAGFSNYTFVFRTYPPFWPAIEHNLLWLLFLSFVATPIGLLLAVLLDQQLRGSRIYQTVFFIPVMMSLALVGIIWQLMYSRDLGLINSVLGTAGHKNAIDWLGDSSINIWAALIAATWKHVGYIMILYLAGLKGIDPSIKEAAAIDGASATQTFFQVVFPAMRPINIVVVVITIIESLRAFDIVYVFNGGTNGLELISALVIQNLVGEGQVIGVGSALAVILLVVALIPIVTYLSRTFRKEER
ncbi:carbohydrate ABC transporter membrane protein 1 (CUT1 family) [Jatrophihabitans sp. GAS493]|uniref:carbohydrate ABC transporter permease n=1 Tax=Jatrophihabitans sp. GAS493 TaxID=1907575 RepID=UPI000BBFC236|nr:sugar ABC transporter permease [Jatrophihabitans sp. GAS493]SOD74471.1 carbohydrate ABC transporter membrane protein 1 (CUT1 family) [Jatrophihabitans sp. GAS493]